MKNMITDYRLQTKENPFSNVEGKQKSAVVRRLWTVDQKAFTLIEVLVAIAIMTIVFGLIISSSVGIRRSTRDQQRITDLQTIQQALLAYYGDQNFYPDTTFSLGSATQITDDSGNPLISTATRTYLSTLPQDPQTVVYRYLPLNRVGGSACDNSSATNTCQYYLICAAVEATPATPSTLCPAQFGSSYNYEINPSQTSGR